MLRDYRYTAFGNEVNPLNSTNAEADIDFTEVLRSASYENGTYTMFGDAFSCIASGNTGERLQIVGNVYSDLRWNAVYWRHLYSGVGGIDRLMNAHASQGQGWIYGSLAVPGVTGIHISNNILSGLLHVADIHSGELGHRAIGWNQPTPLSHFESPGRSGGLL